MSTDMMGEDNMSFSDAEVSAAESDASRGTRLTKGSAIKTAAAASAKKKAKKAKAKAKAISKKAVALELQCSIEGCSEKVKAKSDKCADHGRDLAAMKTQAEKTGEVEYFNKLLKTRRS